MERVCKQTAEKRFWPEFPEPEGLKHTSPGQSVAAIAASDALGVRRHKREALKGRVSRSGSGLSLTRRLLREQTEMRRKEGTWNAETYLCESALVQNSLPEPCIFRRGYAARVALPGGPEEGQSRRSQAERLRETAFRPSWGANHRPWTKHWGSILTTLSSAAMRLLLGNHRG